MPVFAHHTMPECDTLRLACLETKERVRDRRGKARYGEECAEARGAWVQAGRDWRRGFGQVLASLRHKACSGLIQMLGMARCADTSGQTHRQVHGVSCTRCAFSRCARVLRWHRASVSFGVHGALADQEKALC